MKKLKLIGGAIVLALAMLITTQAVLADSYGVFGTLDGEGGYILAGEIFIVIQDQGNYYIPDDPVRDHIILYDHAEGENTLGCIRLDPGWEIYDFAMPDGSLQFIESLNATCYVPDPPQPGGWDGGFFIRAEPTAWSLGVEGAFTTTQMQDFIDPKSYNEGGNDFIPNSGEWITNMLDYALSWLQTINQDDFLFFLMAFGLVNYVIAWLWRQLSGASVMGEAEAWRGMFDGDEE